MVVLVWSDLMPEDLGQVCHLASRCLQADGGLPTLDSKESIGLLFGSGPGRVGRDETGDVVAAVSLFRDLSGHETVTGLVHPSLRGQGVGEDLAHWARSATSGAPLRVALENATAAADDLIAAAGMVKVRSELVMRHDLEAVPILRRPAGLRSLPFDEETAPLFHQAWLDSFGDQPGFQFHEWDDWNQHIKSGSTFLPDRSRVVIDEEDAPVGFVTLSTDWIEQVGVVPRWRGKGLGAHLMVRSLRALKKAGSTQAWLCVTADNPAAGLYERLGFVVVGARGRYADPPPSA